MEVGVVGINHKSAEVKLRELLARVRHKYLKIDDHRPFIVLSTCNRVEVFFHSDDMIQTHRTLLNIFRQEIPYKLEQKFYSYFGFDCFLHLARVTAGLDSAINPG